MLWLTAWFWFSLTTEFVDSHATANSPQHQGLPVSNARSRHLGFTRLQLLFLDRTTNSVSPMSVNRIERGGGAGSTRTRCLCARRVGPTHTESGTLQRKVKHRALPKVYSRQRPNHAPTKRRSPRCLRRRAPHTEHGLGVLSRTLFPTCLCIHISVSFH